jgi:hypothetical protein
VYRKPENVYILSSIQTAVYLGAGGGRAATRETATGLAQNYLLYTVIHHMTGGFFPRILYILEAAGTEDVFCELSANCWPMPLD